MNDNENNYKLLTEENNKLKQQLKTRKEKDRIRLKTLLESTSTAIQNINNEVKIELNRTGDKNKTGDVYKFHENLNNIVNNINQIRKDLQEKFETEQITQNTKFIEELEKINNDLK